MRRSASGLERAILGIALLLTLATSFASAGCATLLGSRRFNAADVRFSLDQPSGPTPSQSASQTLKAYDVPKRGSLEDLDALRAKLQAKPTPELVYAFVETSYLQARALELKRPQVAERLYFDCAIYAYRYMFDPALNAQNSSVFNGQLLDAAVLYNGACERFLHLAIKESENKPFPFLPSSATRLRFDPEGRELYAKIDRCSWRPEEIESFQLVADCPVDGVSFDCLRSGLGVPLVVKRRLAAEHDRPEEKYYPGGLCFPLTALLVPNPSIPLDALPPIDPNARFDSQREAEARATLLLCDPFQQAKVKLGGRDVLLETDITTPLAYFLNEKSELNRKGAKKGLLRPDDMFEKIQTDVPSRERTLQGLYMLEPYDPNKIPVVMTHGLGSSPSTWLDMYNALRNASEIQNAYQFWFYFYPTGRPFWVSAAQLRAELNDLRDAVDPDRSEPMLDQMVLIGHSMGGLISRMQVQDSDDKIWKRISSTPFDEIDLDDDARDEARSQFFFEPNPSVKRVVTIASPFEGSDFANNFTQWLAERAIALPQKATRALSNLARRNRGQIDDPTLLETNTSVDSLSPKCPIFKALDECEIPPDVALNNIVGVLPNLANRKIAPKKTDGVVEFWSSHRDDVETEREVSASHTKVQMHPATILEVKEILSRHIVGARRQVASGIAPPPRPQNFDNRPAVDLLPHYDPLKDEDYPVDNAYRPEENRRSSDSYQSGKSYRPDEVNRPSDGYLPSDEYRSNEGYRPSGGYRPNEGYQPNGGYRPSDGYQPNEGYRTPDGPPLTFPPELDLR